MNGLSFDDRLVTATTNRASSRAAAARVVGLAPSARRGSGSQAQEGERDAAAEPQSDAQWSQWIDEHATLILSVLDGVPDISLVDLQTRLARRGAAVDIGALWEFFERRRTALAGRAAKVRDETSRPAAEPIAAKPVCDDDVEQRPPWQGQIRNSGGAIVRPQDQSEITLSCTCQIYPIRV